MCVSGTFHEQFVPGGGDAEFAEPLTAHPLRPRGGGMEGGMGQGVPEAMTRPLILPPAPSPSPAPCSQRRHPRHTTPTPTPTATIDITSTVTPVDVVDIAVDNVDIDVVDGDGGLLVSEDEISVGVGGLGLNFNIAVGIFNPKKPHICALIHPRINIIIRFKI